MNIWWHCFFFVENYEVAEAKAFFESNYSHIYYIFNDNFASVEADLKQRGKFKNDVHVIHRKVVLFRWL